MLIKLATGANPSTVESTLRQVASDAFNARAEGGLPRERVDSYLRWANLAASRLWNQVDGHEIERLVLTRAYYALVVLTREPSPQIGEMVDRELAARLADLNAAEEALGQVRKRWPAGSLVVLDTSVFLNHPNKLEFIDFRGWAWAQNEPVHVVVPMAVVDELDNSKRLHGRAGWRAAYSLAVLDANAPTPGDTGNLQEGGPPNGDGEMPPGRVTFEVWPDPPGHVRLAINDDEIVDRAATVQQLAGRSVAFVTYDTGQAMRARGAGLKVQRMIHPIEDVEEPDR